MHARKISNFLILIFMIALIAAIISIFSDQSFQRNNFHSQLDGMTNTAKIEIQSEIIRAYEAARTASENGSPKNWFAGDGNRLYKEMALMTMRSLMIERGFDSEFAAQVLTGDYSVGENGVVLLVDDRNMVNFSSHPEFINRSLGDLISHEPSPVLGYKAQKYIMFNGEKSVLVESQIKNTNMDIVLIARTSDFISSNWKIRKISVFFIAVLLIFLCVILYVTLFSQKKIINNLENGQDLTIFSMSLLAELKDNETGAHIKRTRDYCHILASELSKNNKYRKYLTREYIQGLGKSAPLHDIGKVGIPDNILGKAEKLTVEEFEVMKKHTVLGADILDKTMNEFGVDSYIQIGYQLVKHHHENWDGSGYPDGLSGEDIPLSARIMAVADVYDALRSERVYKESFSHEKVMNIMKGESGIKFDPEIISALQSIEEKIDAVFNDLNK